MTGSMSHAAAIGLGLAETDRSGGPVIVLDGDGALIMHLGILSTIGRKGGKRLTHVVLDNGIYESTWRTKTTALTTQFGMVAGGCGYARSSECCSPIDVGSAMHKALSGSRASLIVIKVMHCNHEPPSIMAVAEPAQLAQNFRSGMINLRADARI